MKIIVVKRTSDYMAYVDGNKGIWESGATQAEAVGKLLISLCGRLSITIWLPFPTKK